MKVTDVYRTAPVPEYYDAADLLARARAAFGTDYRAVGSLFAMKNRQTTPIARRS